MYSFILNNGFLKSALAIAAIATLIVSLIPLSAMAQAPTTGTLVVQKVVDGGPTATSSFSFEVNGGGAVNFEADGENVLSGMATGTYTVTEVAVADYDTSYNNCENVVVSAGATSTCTITNTFNPAPTTTNGTVTIVKSVPASVGNWSFDFSGDFGAFALSNTSTSTVFSNVASGTYSVSEVVPAGWEVTNIACSEDGTQNTTTSNSAATINVEADESVTCTFTNEPLPSGPLSCTLNADRTVVRENSRVNLTWTTTGASSVQIDNGVGTTSANGTVEVIPSSDTTYTLTAENATSSVSCNVAIDTQSSSGSGGSSVGGGGRDLNDDDDDEDEDEDEDEDDDDDGPNIVIPRVLGEQTTVIPTGAPNTGAGGTATTNNVPAILGLLTLFGGLVLSRFKSVM